MATLVSERLIFSSYDEMLNYLEEHEIGDGLPVALPTPERVAEFVEASGRPATDVLGTVAPSWHKLSVEKVAVNAVMAGCRPEYMVVVLAGLEAMLQERFRLFGLQSTTHPGGPLLLVSGPVVARLGINAGAGAFGPGPRANATIGRAIRLVLLNVGRGRPGTLDRSTQGQSCKFSFCVGENDADSPWEPFRVDQGFGLDESVVFAAGLEGPHSISDGGSYSGEQLLTTIAGTIATSGSSAATLGRTDPDDHGPYIFLFLCPEHAHQIADDGFGRRDVQEYLFGHARVDVRWMGKGHLDDLRQRHRANPRYVDLGLDVETLTEVPLLSCPADLAVVVVGGAGKYSSVAPPTTMPRFAARRVV